MSDLKIAVQMYTLRDACNTPKELSETLRRVKEIGFQSIELAGLGPVDAREYSRMLEGEGLSGCCCHFGYGDLSEDIDTVIAQAQTVGCPYVGIGALPPDMRNRKGYQTWARQGSEIGARLKEAGLGLVYHNHYWELERFDTETGLDILYNGSDSDLFLAQIDTYWIQYGGGDPAAWILKWQGRLPIVHFKDMGVSTSQDTKHIMMPVGEGNLNWPRIIEAADAAGARYAAVEQDHCQGDPFESIAVSLRNLKAMGLQT